VAHAITACPRANPLTSSAASSTPPGFGAGREGSGSWSDYAPDLEAVDSRCSPCILIRRWPPAIGSRTSAAGYYDGVIFLDDDGSHCFPCLDRATTDKLSQSGGCTEPHRGSRIGREFSKLNGIARLPRYILVIPTIFGNASLCRNVGFSKRFALAARRQDGPVVRYALELPWIS